MPKNETPRRLMDEQDLMRWREATLGAMAGDEVAIADTTQQPIVPPDFYNKSRLHFSERRESLLTKALHTGVSDDGASDAVSPVDMARQRSLRSNLSTTSTTDLTSDGGLTSPARTSTPSPPIPNQTYVAFGQYTLGPKLAQAAMKAQSEQKPFTKPAEEIALPKVDPAVEALVKKRTISFACGKAKEPVRPTQSSASTTSEEAKPVVAKRTIKFACAAKPKEPVIVEPEAVAQPQPTSTIIPQKPVVVQPVRAATPPLAKLKIPQRQASRSPSMTRKFRPSSSRSNKHRDSTGTIRRASQSPCAVRTRKPKFIAADEEALEISEATHFHEFASDEPREEDWIRTVVDESKRITINDTLKKENLIRRLAEEAEQEDEEDEDDDYDDDEGENDDDDDDDNEDDDEDEDNDDDVELDEEDETAEEAEQDFDDDETVSVASGVTDGNETDNEAGFADSDDESESGDYEFWTPGGKSLFSTSGEISMIRTVRRQPSHSSIDSLEHMSPVRSRKGLRTGRMKPSRKIAIRPGTPELPDSTDFVCGTLDEDRPLEEAYISCMEARRREKHHLIPQDIDPSFPTSDPEEEEDEVDELTKNESDDGLWLHGKFEDSGDERRPRRRKSPNHSPKRLHSPPPPKHRSPPPTRHRSPPLRRLFGHSPKVHRSPPKHFMPRSPMTSPANATVRPGIRFAPLGDRPDLISHTKSLPRRQNGFEQAYRLARMAAVQEEADDDNNASDHTPGHTRGAIDIVKGLEQKRQRRRDKFYSKLCKERRKGGKVERTVVPGKGAERMREVGLMMAGITTMARQAGVEIRYAERDGGEGERRGRAEYVLSV